MIIIVPLVIVAGIIAWMLRPKNSTKPVLTAILATVIPPLLLAIAAIGFQLLHNAAGKTWVSDISNGLVIATMGIVAVAILALIGFVFAHKSDIAKGIGFGICLAFGILVLEWGLLEWLGGV